MAIWRSTAARILLIAVDEGNPRAAGVALDTAVAAAGAAVVAAVGPGLQPRTTRAGRGGCCGAPAAEAEEW